MRVTSARSTRTLLLLCCALFLGASTLQPVDAKYPFAARALSALDFRPLNARNATIQAGGGVPLDGGVIPKHQKECRKVNKHHIKDKCAYIHKNCDDAQVGLINYLDFYYCKFPTAKAVPFTVLAIWLATLFTTIGIAASDFFCVNLSTIATILGMSESMAGVTFLAFGNGSPDVFSTFAAMKVDSGSLAVGELIGAASFITAVVAGSMAIVRPFKVAKKSFVRDVIFFSISVCFGIFFLWDGRIKLWECVVMISFYIFYVIFVCVWHWWQKKVKRRRRVDYVSRGHYTDIGEEDAEDEDDDEGGMGQGQPPRLVLNTDFDALESNGNEFEDAMSDDEEENERDQFTELNTNMQRLGRPSIARMTTPATPAIRPSLIGAFEFRALLQSFEKERNLPARPIHLRSYSDDPYFHPGSTSSAPGTLTVTSPIEGPHSAIEPGRAARKVRASLGAGLAPPRQGRLRAVSVNDALLKGSNKPGPSFGVRQDSIPEAEESSSDDNPTPTQLDYTPPPLIEFFGPSTPRPEQNPFNSYNFGPPDSHNHLAPPSPSGRIPPNSSGGSSPVSPTTGSPLLLPVLHDSPGSSRGSSPSRYLESPRPMSIRSGKSLPQIPALDLPGSASSSRSVYGDVTPPTPLRWWPYALLPSPQILLSTLFPTLWCFHEKSIVQMFLGVVAAPAVFLLTITLPVVEGPSPSVEQQAVDTLISPSNGLGDVNGNGNGLHRSDSQPISDDASGVDTHAAWKNDEDEKPREWNRWLVAVQCITSPVFIVLVIFGGEIPLLKPILYALLGGLVALAGLLVFTTPEKPPKYRYYLCFMGFVVSIAWISTVANEVVGVLKCFGAVLGISDAILGLTIFAVGNSLGDLVADITVARLGFPVMALSACFGGPMLNILLGVGISGLYMTLTVPPDRNGYEIEVSSTLMISAITLLATLLFLLVAVPLNGWRMTKRIGWSLVAIWTVSTIVNLGVEIAGVGKDKSE